MAEENGNGGYWKGYPSYLLEGRDRIGAAFREDVRLDVAPSRRRADSGYWGSLEQHPASAPAASGPRAVQGGRSDRPAQEEPMVQPVAMTRSHIIAGLLAVFFGFFGIHKFYLGYNSTGIIMLAVSVMGSFFTFGLAGMVMGVIGVVEGIIYLVTGQVAFDRTYVHNKKEWF